MSGGIIALIVLTIIVLFVVINVFLSDKKDPRPIYLGQLAGFVGSSLEKMEGVENSYRVKFVYQGREFAFEDIEDPGFRSHSYKGYLKIATPVNLTLSFTEKSRPSIRANIKSINDISNPWGGGAQKVHLPKALEEFEAFSNNPEIANQLLSDDSVIREFLKFKSRESRGYPVMSLEIMSGTIALKYHPRNELTPNLFTLRHRVQLVAEHAKSLMVVADKLLQFKQA